MGKSSPHTEVLMFSHMKRVSSMGQYLPSQSVAAPVCSHLSQTLHAWEGLHCVSAGLITPTNVVKWHPDYIDSS